MGFPSSTAGWPDGYTRNEFSSRRLHDYRSGYVMCLQSELSGAANRYRARWYVPTMLAGEAAPTELGQVTTATFANPWLKPLGKLLKPAQVVLPRWRALYRRTRKVSAGIFGLEC